MTLPQEVAKRRTFAIISHPDAGKTTLTEKLLLLGGAIHLAGEVKAKGNRRRARSDWMKIEQQRGISVTTSVMTFQYQNWIFNLLDTPGHEDFSEDTYRTLTAVDSAIMVIDAARGIEPQTLKLFEVCRLRDIPITTFINKMDREARDPFDLLEDISKTLALDMSPMNWPCGMGRDFKGVHNFMTEQFEPFGNDKQSFDVTGPHLAAHLGQETAQSFLEESELARGGNPPFNLQSYQEGHLSPVYFGSALKNFGVNNLLQGIGQNAPPPQPRPTTSGLDVEPENPEVSGFVFKVQANMDPNHRDRIAFLRLCSGGFKRGMKLKHIHTGKMMNINNPILFFAQDRELAQAAWPGDIIGIPNHGTLRVGDSLCEKSNIRFSGIPSFAPEILCTIRIEDAMKNKHLRKALEGLSEEGVVQVFRPILGGHPIVGVVGQLQLDVLKTRMESEYNLNVILESAPCQTARWLVSDDPKALEDIQKANRRYIAHDRDGAIVFLTRNAWELNHQKEKYKTIKFLETREIA